MTAGCAKNFIGSKSTTAINFKYLSISMDNLFKKYKIKYPNKIKIDVDGNELYILNGMNKILKVYDEIYIELTNSKNKYDYYNNKIYKFLIKKNFYLHNFYNDNFLFKKNKIHFCNRKLFPDEPTICHGSAKKPCFFNNFLTINGFPFLTDPE